MSLGQIPSSDTTLYITRYFNLNIIYKKKGNLAIFLYTNNTMSNCLGIVKVFEDTETILLIQKKW